MVETPPLLRICSPDRSGIKVTANNDPVGNVPDLLLKTIDNPINIRDGLMLCKVAGEVETPAPHPIETVNLSGYQDRTTALVEGCDIAHLEVRRHSVIGSQANRYSRSFAVFLLCILKRKTLLVSLKLLAVLNTGRKTQWLCRYCPRSPDHRPVRTAGAQFAYTIKSLAFKTRKGCELFEYASPDPPNLDVVLGEKFSCISGIQGKNYRLLSTRIGLHKKVFPSMASPRTDLI
ncbi:hypothetical protein J6590_074305 [Homalodisca vitripennis]|nr:hypothetical protein J6590_074305 [Homalodisca vitripennis]